MTALFKDYDPGDAVKCPNCLAKKDDVWNRVIEPTRGGEVDIKRLVAMMGKEEYEEPPEEHKRRLASPMPPLEKREKGWQDIIHLAKTASMGARSKRSKKAAETARASGWYHERHIAPKLEREKLLQARKQWAGPKHEHWDQQVEYLADEADIDNAAMELLIGKYMDNRGDFPTPFDFDRLDIDDAVNALNIIQGIDAKDIMKLAEEARRYFDAILEDRTPSTILDDMAKCLVIDLGSADANALYRDLRAVNGSLDPFCPPVYRETIEFNKTYREAEEMFDALLLEAKPIAKLMRVVPMADLDPWRSKSWAVVLNDAEVSGSLARRNADKIKRMFTEGMRRTAPWALRPLKRLTRAASIEDSPIIAETISHIWNALIDDKPMVYSEYRDALKLATMYGAGELFNACL
jgi:hypothetical protein